MLNSVKPGSDDFLWKRSIPLKEKIFTIGIIFDLVLVRGAPLIEWSIGQFI